MSARILELRLSSDQSLSVGRHLTVIVGPNNVGKSVVLSSTWARILHRPGYEHPIDVPAVGSVSIVLPDRSMLDERLHEGAVLNGPGQHSYGGYNEPSWFDRDQHSAPVSFIDGLYRNGGHTDHLGPFLGRRLGMHLQPEFRLGQLGQVAVPNLLVEAPNLPLQRLWADRDLEDRVRTLTRRAFDIDLTVNRHGGSQTSLHVERATSEEPPIGTLSPYLNEVAQLPLAQAQGHGVQAFLGIVLTLISRRFDFVLIDEPEAFLHPPQAKLLGEIFVELAKEGTQIVVATHSADFLTGVLTASAGDTEVTVARLTRPTPPINAVAQLSPTAARDIYDDALLRYSRILDGIFYKGVAICESEGDCKYYAAVLDHQHALADAGAPRPDLLFTQCGGKDRMAKAAQALIATKVPVAVIADIDLLADRAKFEELFTVLGGDPGRIASRLNTVEAGVRPRGVRPNRAFVLHQATAVLNAADDKEVQPGEVKALRDLLKVQSGWEMVKKHGRGALPGGDATSSFDHVLAECRAIGLFLVPVGELERFHPDLPASNKAAWLRQVFEEGRYKDSPDAVALLEGVVKHIRGRQ